MQVEAAGTIGAQVEGARTRVRRGLSGADYLTLCAIGLVVVLVSLPKLRAFALRENEFDAMRTLRLLADDASRRAGAMHAGGLGALLATSVAHRERLQDVELFPDGRLRRHGYLFDALELAPGEWLLRAWPWEHGHSGLGAFEIAPAGALRGCANADGAFSGPAAAPPPWNASGALGWVEMPIADR